jgi:hypothetical protein
VFAHGPYVCLFLSFSFILKGQIAFFQLCFRTEYVMIFIYEVSILVLL